MFTGLWANAEKLNSKLQTTRPQFEARNIDQGCQIAHCKVSVIERKGDWLPEQGDWARDLKLQSDRSENRGAQRSIRHHGAEATLSSLPRTASQIWVVVVSNSEACALYSYNTVLM